MGKLPPQKKKCFGGKNVISVHCQQGVPFGDMFGLNLLHSDCVKAGKNTGRRIKSKNDSLYIF